MFGNAGASSFLAADVFGSSLGEVLFHGAVGAGEWHRDFKLALGVARETGKVGQVGSL